MQRQRGRETRTLGKERKRRRRDVYRTHLSFFLFSPLRRLRTKQPCKVCAVSVCQSLCKDFYYDAN